MSTVPSKYREKYPHLFAPLEVGKNRDVYKNRIFIGPRGVGGALNQDNVLTDSGIAWNTVLAAGGYACINLGEAKLDNGPSMAHGKHYDLTTDANLDQFHHLTQVANVFGVKMGIELNHNGHFSLPEYCGGQQPMSASAMKMPNGNLVREMTEEDMEQVAESYAKAALRARRGGFEQILLHYGHGWLMGGWMSPLVNRRTDRHGGSVENRARFPRMVLERIRKEVGDSIHLELRISGSELVPGGLEIEEVTEFIKIYQDLVDLVHISCGTRMAATTRADMHPSQFLPHAHNAEMSKYVKEHGVAIPVGVVGNISDPVRAERLLAEGYADYIVMVRSTIADPEWARKVREGREDDIRPCLRCNHCLDLQVGRVAVATNVLQNFQASNISLCAVNPLVGHNSYKSKIPLSPRSKRVVIVGGGPAGLNAAIFAADQGHQVTLFERDAELGGIINYAKHVPFKHDLAAYRDYLVRQVEKRSIDVRLGVTATPELVRLERPDAVLVAVGSEPVTPPIPGADRPHVMQAAHAHDALSRMGERVVIIGGGISGCELSIHLNRSGKRAAVVEMGEHLCPEAQLSERLHVLRYMEQAGVESHTQFKCVEILEDSVVCQDADGVRHALPADTVVLAAGMRPRSAQRDLFEDCAFDVIPMGDCKKAALVETAVNDAYNAVLAISAL